eukprot:2538189-Amphidinium_carterae.2
MMKVRFFVMGLNECAAAMASHSKDGTLRPDGVQQMFCEACFEFHVLVDGLETHHVDFCLKRGRADHGSSAKQ